MYTLVQHSGFGVAGKPAFAQAVEEAYVKSPKAVGKIREAGGLVFLSYGEASKYAHEINYPPEVGGLTPAARGTFHSRIKVGGLRLYLPSEWDLTLVAVEEIMET